ncbi:MAG: 30S ribosomal protein S20 [Patescibacteria group bacterium]
MANIKSAQKKVRKDKKRRMSNVSYKSKIDQILRTSENKSNVDVSTSYAVIDKAAKRGVISHERAARLKSKISSVK